MSLVHLDQISLAYGHKPLLDHADLRIESGERICLVGRNGEGKSTLLRVLLGEQHAYNGHVRREHNIVFGHIEQ
jgi:ATP-binding cassette subfamily F protein uup